MSVTPAITSWPNSTLDYLLLGLALVDLFDFQVFASPVSFCRASRNSKKYYLGQQHCPVSYPCYLFVQLPCDSIIVDFALAVACILQPFHLLTLLVQPASSCRSQSLCWQFQACFCRCEWPYLFPSEIAAYKSHLHCRFTYPVDDEHLERVFLEIEMQIIGYDFLF